LDTYGLLKDAMAVSNKRAELISTNIANVNTTDFKAKRVQFESELQRAIGQNGFKLNTTHEKHIRHEVKNVQPKIVENQNTRVKENGNNVDLEVEMLDQATNGLYYSALTAQLNGRFKMMNYVLSN
jgi:flagellar basal-body rod protein FlgB